MTCSTYTKIGTIQRRLAWPLRKDDTQIREAFHIFQHLSFLRNEQNLTKDHGESDSGMEIWLYANVNKSPCGLMDKALDF